MQTRAPLKSVTLAERSNMIINMTTNKYTNGNDKRQITPKHIFTILLTLTLASLAIASASENLVKITSTIMIENDGASPLNHYLIERDEQNKSRLSHIVAKLDNVVIPVTTADDNRLWRIDLSSRPIEPGTVMPLTITKVYTHLEIVPSCDIYLIPYSIIQYQARVIKQGKPQKIKLPSDQYSLVVDNKELVDLDTTTSTAMALETEGSSRVSLIDQKVVADEDFIQPGSNIHIVNPSYMTMHITPGDSWALQKFTDYTLEIRIFDEHHHQIYPSDNLDIQLVASNEVVVTSSTVNGTFHSIHSLTSGTGKLTATLLGTTPINYSFGRPTQHIEVTRELTIHDSIDVKPTALVLPWIPEVSPIYHLSIYAAGGTGSYKWTTNNSDLIDISYSVDDSSVAKVTTNGEGTAFIVCSATKSPVFTKHSMIAITKVDEISILPSIIETEIGGDILLPIAVYSNVSSMLGMHLQPEELNSGLVLFHDCSKIKFNIDIIEKTRFTHDPTEVVANNHPKACISLRFTCSQPGTSRVWISYSENIKTTALISCYKPLKAVYPSDIGVLALKTSIDVAFEGGPRPFANRYDDHYALLSSDTKGVISHEPILDRYRYNKDLHVFRISCKEFGEATLTLSVGNQPSPSLTNPASSSSSVQIFCSKPDSIQVRPRLRETCPLNEMASLIDTIIPVSTQSQTDFELILFDDSKRRFLNISSFNAHWTHTGPIKSSSKQREEVNAVAGYRRIVRNYVSVNPTGDEGFGELRATVSDLSFELELQFVDSAVINSNRTIVFNHVKNVVGLSILKGSGYFSVESLQGAKHANVSYMSIYGQHKITVTPLAVGDFSVRLDDQCIDSKSVLTDVSIVNADQFKKETFKPGNTMHFCDEVLFCIYLHVTRPSLRESKQEKPVTKAAVSTTTTQTPTTVRPVAVTVLSTLPSQQFIITSPAPRIVQETSEASSIFHQVVGYFLMLIVTFVFVLLSYKWWQQQRQKPSTVVSSTSFSSSFESPSSRLNRSQSPTSQAFSPSTTTTSGFGSNSPHVRPLYSEKFASCGRTGFHT